MTITPEAIVAAAAGDVENFLVAATPGGIERKEKDGQQALVQSTNMPVKMLPDRESFEAVGFTFGDPVDDIFLSATLPAGWTRVATDHAMYSKIIDDKGRNRVSIFYKAAFYDRSAHANLECRYRRSCEYSSGRGKTAETVCDNGVVIQSFPLPDVPEGVDRSYGSDVYEANQLVRQQADAWIDEHYPRHQDPTAYWDDVPAPTE